MKTLVVLCFLMGHVSYGAEVYRKVKAYQKIILSGPFKAKIKPGKQEQILIKGSSATIKKISIRQSGKELTVEGDRGSLREKIEVIFYNSELTSVTLEKGSSFYGKISPTNRLNFSLKGSSTANFFVNTDEVNVDIAGGSQLVLNGKTDSLDLSCHSGSVFSGLGLRSDEARVTSEGHSDVSVNVSDSLRAKSQKGAKISYKGNPKVKTSGESGSITRVK